MGKSRTVPHRMCIETGKRSFVTEADAEKALGRAQSKRARGQRGTRMESRFYECWSCDGYHLTGMSRREFGRVVVTP